MTSTSDQPATVPPWRGARGPGISQWVLVACAPFGPRLPGAAVADAIARGIENAGGLQPDVCALPAPSDRAQDVQRVLDELDFDARMLRARAVVIGAARLEEQTLAGSVTIEIATRARQRGVPAYAVAREDALDSFDARVLDLQVILRARGRAGLVKAGLQLAGLV